MGGNKRQRSSGWVNTNTAIRQDGEKNASFGPQYTTNAMTEKQTPEQEQQPAGAAAEDLASETNEPTVPIPDDSPVEEANSVAGDLDAALADADAAKQVGDLSLEVAEAKAQALRAQAELENFRKRVRREMEIEQRFAALPLVSDLLPIVDNLQRAITASAGNEAAAGVVEGVTMVANQLTAALEKHHCAAINPVGEPFDPNMHEAIAQHPTTEQEPGTVAHVAQIGYRLHDRVVRPAQVVVASAPPEEAATTEDSDS